MTEDTFHFILLEPPASDVFNVRDFGAVGNGKADDTAAFQAAIDACHAAMLVGGEQRRVHVPGGDYRVGELSVPSGLVMWGDGSTTARLFARDAGQTTLSVVAAKENSGTISIRDMSFIGAGRQGTGIRLEGTASDRRVHDVRIEDCLFYDLETAVSLRLAANVWLARLHAASCTTGFRIDTSGDVRATNCFASNGEGWGFWISDDGLHGASGEGVYLTTCTTNVQGGGLKVENHHWGAAIGCSFTSNTGPAVELDGHGWRINAAEIATSKFTHPGIVLSDNSEKVVVTGSYFALNSHGIVAGGKDHLIASNIFESGATEGQDIVLAGRNILASGNIARSRSAVSIKELPGAAGNLIDNNMVWGAIERAGTSSVITASNYRVDPTGGKLLQVQQPPGLTASDYVATPGERIPAAALFVAADANGDMLHYSLRDDNPATASGHWELAGKAVPAGQTVTLGADALPGLVFVAGTLADSLAVRVSDGVMAPSDWATLSIIPGSGKPLLRITPQLTIDEIQARALLEVWIEGTLSAPVTVSWSVDDGTARVADRDLPPEQGGVLTFLPGGPTVQQILVLVNDQADVLEGEEYFTVRLSGASGAVLGDAVAMVKLRDDFAATGPAPILMLNTTTGESSLPALLAYDGPVTSLSGMFHYLGTDNVVLVAKAPNVFLRSGEGNDALSVAAGQNVLDAGAGSNFLVGGVGADTFYVDGRAQAGSVWSTVTNLGTGDAVTLWGVSPTFGLHWAEQEGAPGYEGLTLHATAPDHPGASLTLSGFVTADLENGRLGVLFGRDPGTGNDYAHIYTSV